MGGIGSGGKPRVYPQEIVDLICGMYRDGMTVAEIRQQAPRGYARMCVSCHRKFDAARRALTGRRTSPRR